MAGANPAMTSTQRGVEGLELLELLARGVARRVLGGVRHVLFGVLDLRREARAIEILDRHRHVGEHGEALAVDLGKTAHHHDAPGFARAADRQDARLEQGDQRRVMGEHAEIALGTRDVDPLDLAREHHLLGRNQVEAKRVRHATSSTQAHAASASFLPFSTACSIVPTMYKAASGRWSYWPSHRPLKP